MISRLVLPVLMLSPLWARAEEAPTASMLDPVRVLANCMAQALPAACPLQFAARNVVIVDNFSPYLFVGADAVERWRTGFRRHLATGHVGKLQFRFGEPRDFSRDGSRVFFVVPTSWSGTAGSSGFEERGAWSFVLLETYAGWQVLGSAWGAFESTIRPLPPEGHRGAPREVKIKMSHHRRNTPTGRGRK